MKEKRLHLRANKDNPPSPSSSDTESSEDVDPNYGKMCFQFSIGTKFFMTLAVSKEILLSMFLKKSVISLFQQESISRMRTPARKKMGTRSWG